MSETDLALAEQERWIGQEVEGKYRVLHLVGRGGMGAVYEAENLVLGKRVALKFIDVESAKDEGLIRFEREARAAGTVESNHVVQVFDVGMLEDGRPFIVMEMLRGENLGVRLQRVGRLQVSEAVHVGVQVLRGLHRAHEKGIVHRDLKPENVFLVETDGDPMFVKIVDFGISKITKKSASMVPNTITREGVVLGTPFYMAPEQAQAKADLDERADLWSLGAILYECLGGRRPFLGDTYEQVIIAICTTQPPDLHDFAPEVPDPLRDVVMKALARDRADRFPSAKAFLEALGSAVPTLVGSVPFASDPSMDRTIRATTGPELGVRTDVSWSSAGNRLAEGVDVLATGTKRRTKLMLLGALLMLVAFVSTVGIVRGFRLPQGALEVEESEAAAVESEAAVSSVGTIRIETDVPGANVEVNGRVSPEGMVFGLEGEARRVVVRAPGYVEEERTLLITPGESVVRIELARQEVETVASAVPARSLAPPPVRPSRTPSPPPPESSSLTGGLELKTEIP